MYPNLRAEMARLSIGGNTISTKIGISNKAFSNKMVGKSEFTLAEIMKIKNSYFKDLSVEYLFQRSQKHTA